MSFRSPTWKKRPHARHSSRESWRDVPSVKSALAFQPLGRRAPPILASRRPLVPGARPTRRGRWRTRADDRRRAGRRRTGRRRRRRRRTAAARAGRALATWSAHRRRRRVLEHLAERVIAHVHVREAHHRRRAALLVARPRPPSRQPSFSSSTSTNSAPAGSAAALPLPPHPLVRFETRRIALLRRAASAFAWTSCATWLAAGRLESDAKNSSSEASASTAAGAAAPAMLRSTSSIAAIGCMPGQKNWRGAASARSADGVLARRRRAAGPAADVAAHAAPVVRRRADRVRVRDADVQRHHHVQREDQQLGRGGGICASV